MLEIKFIRQVLIFAFAAAVVYCTTAWVYIKHMNFEETYVLYVGNFLFATVIAIFVAWFYKRHQSDISTARLVVIGGKTAVAGIVMTCILLFVLLVILIPSVFKPESVSHIQLQRSPGQFEGKNQGFGAILFLNAILGNAGTSFFISLLIPFAVMKNLYEDERRENSKQSVTSTENPKKNYHL